jgi:hypothetical protein
MCGDFFLGGTEGMGLLAISQLRTLPNGSSTAVLKRFIWVKFYFNSLLSSCKINHPRPRGKRQQNPRQIMKCQQNIAIFFNIFFVN